MADIITIEHLENLILEVRGEEKHELVENFHQFVKLKPSQNQPTTAPYKLPTDRCQLITAN